MPSRRNLLVSVMAAGLLLERSTSAAGRLPGSSPANGGSDRKVLRYAFEVAETSLDPVRVDDIYSLTLTQHIFEGLFHYDHLARPAWIVPLTADGLPQVSADFRVWTIKIKPGIFFVDDIAFRGRRRELVAQDFAYTFKRFADPANISPAWTNLEAEGLVGLAELRNEAIKSEKPFNYDRVVEGVSAPERYTLRFKLKNPRPRFLEVIADGGLYGAVAREVVDLYGPNVDAHPVGTGPFKLATWRRGSFIVLDRNPDYRERYYDARPPPGDVEGQALLARLKGRRLPMIDRVEISIVEEEQSRWLSFLNGEVDLARGVGFEFVGQAMPNGRMAPNLDRRGLRGYRVVEPGGTYVTFNMEDPIVGGYAAQKVALRRAIGLGMDVRRSIDYAYSGLGTVAQGPMLPETSAFDDQFKSECGDYDPARAKALLDLYGYRDVDGDGWREMPGGGPLILRFNTQPDQRSRKVSELMIKDMAAIGVRLRAVVAQWPENLKAAQAGKFQMWSVAAYASQPDSIGAFERFDSTQVGGQNFARFKLPAFDALYKRMKSLPDGPARAAVFREAEELAVAYMPYKNTVNRLAVDMTYPQLVGYRRPVFWLDWWQYVDIDNSAKRG